MAALLSRDDFRRIGLSLAIALAMLAGGAAAVAYSTRTLQAEQKTHRAALAKRNEVRGKLSRAREEEMDLRQKIGHFNELGTRGIVGDERRLEWVEQIRRIRQARRLLELQYEIAPQRVLDGTELPGAGGKFEFLASATRLKMDLVHEEDLLNFLADLRASMPAHLQVDSCVVERVAPGGGDRTAARLKADCALDFVTLREKPGS